jgi:hypothetical protein
MNDIEVIDDELVYDLTYERFDYRERIMLRKTPSYFIRVGQRTIPEFYRWLEENKWRFDI